MSKHQLHIMLLLDSRNFGGIETHVANLANGLAADGHGVTVVLMNNYGKHPVFESGAIPNVNLCKLNGRVLSFYQLLKHIPCDLVHTHGYKAGILGRIVCRLMRKPVVSTFHAGEKGSLKMQCYRWLDICSAGLGKSISVSQEIANALSGKSSLIQNFVEPVAQEYNHQRQHQIAFVGRLSIEKGPDIFSNVAKQIPDGLFTMYGDGPMYDELLSEKPENITMMGQVASMSDYWTDIKLLCITSRAEGLPLVALEAMSRGIPVVSFEIGGLPSLIKHNTNGWVVQEHSAIAFASQLKQVLCLKPGHLNLLSNNAKQVIRDKFSTSAVLPQIYRVYQHAIGEINKGVGHV